MFQTLSAFYNSEEWRSFRRMLIEERTNKEDGVLYCQHSGKALVLNYDIVLHHIKPLTMANVNDYSVSLNPDNILIVSQSAHNEIHGRFGYCAQRKVYFVYGAPCAGKTTFVNNIRGNSDLIVDIDNIWQAVTGGARYEKPKALNMCVFGVRDLLLEMVRTRAGKWERAFIITGAPLRGDRERQILSLGAEPIYIDTPREECIKRLYSDDTRTEPQKKQWLEFIEQYFKDFQE